MTKRVEKKMKIIKINKLYKNNKKKDQRLQNALSFIHNKKWIETNTAVTKTIVGILLCCIFYE